LIEPTTTTLRASATFLGKSQFDDRPRRGDENNIFGSAARRKASPPFLHWHS
jgi:hypothetical protein